MKTPRILKFNICYDEKFIDYLPSNLFAQSEAAISPPAIIITSFSTNLPAPER